MDLRGELDRLVPTRVEALPTEAAAGLPGAAAYSAPMKRPRVPFSISSVP